MNPGELRRELERIGLRPSRSLGQNFLIDPVYLIRIAEAGEITKGDVVLEIGAGLGNLTRELARLAEKVYQGTVVLTQEDGELAVKLHGWLF